MEHPWVLKVLPPPRTSEAEPVPPVMDEDLLPAELELVQKYRQKLKQDRDEIDFLLKEALKRIVKLSSRQGELLYNTKILKHISDETIKDYVMKLDGCDYSHSWDKVILQDRQGNFFALCYAGGKDWGEKWYECGSDDFEGAELEAVEPVKVTDWRSKIK